MIYINCDIGERGPDHLPDIDLMDHIHIANIACGGHAGDRESINAFRKRADEKGVTVSAHLSYPDREHFGRIHIDIPYEKLRVSLDSQHELLKDIQLVKFHGALYNESTKDSALAEMLADWLQSREIKKVIAPLPSALSHSCLCRNIEILAEAFAERRYLFDPETDTLSLVLRTRDYASIQNCIEAVEQTRGIVMNKKVKAVIEKPDGTVSYTDVPINADTICIHSDSEISLELAKQIADLNEW